MASHLRSRAVALVFAAALCAPAIAGALGVRGGSATAEADDAGARSWTLFGWFDRFNDRFPLRSALIHAHALAALALHVSPSPTVIRGRDGWLYYADDSALDDYVSAAPLSQEELEVWRAAIVRTRDDVRALGAAYVFTIAPDKHVIYPEHMPSSIHRMRDEYRLQQLTDYLRRTTDVAVVDLREPLLADKPVEPVYFRTDTHWNDAGAYVGYAALLTAAARQVPSLQPAPRCAFRDVVENGPGRDLAEMLGIEHDVTERTMRLEPRNGRRARVIEPADMSAGFEVGRAVTEIPGAALPRLVVFRDSFGSALIPLLSEHFSRAVYLWQNDVDLDVVRHEQPALVIQEIVGRRLQTYVPYQ